MTLRRIDVFSPSGGVGKSFVALRLAQLYAQGGRAVLLIDGDITGPCLGNLIEPRVRWSEAVTLVQLICGRPEYLPERLSKDLLPVYVWRQRPTERDELKNPRRITDAPEGFAGMIAFCPSLAQPRCGPRDVGAQGEDMNVDPVVLNAILGHERLGGWVSHVIESVISATADIMGDTLDAVIVDHAASMGPLAWAALSASAAQKEQRSLFVSNRSAIALSAQGEMARHVRTHPGLQDRAVWLVNQVPTDEMSGAWRTRISEIFPDETWHLRDNVLPVRRDSALADTLGSPIIPAGQNSSCDEDLQKVLGRLLR